MSAKVPFTKENLDTYLRKLGKEFRRLNGTVIPAEIILIGGASVLVNYGFRDLTYNIDAIICATSVMKEAINRVGDQLELPNNWLNADFCKTSSYSDRLIIKSVYYKTFSNILTVRTVSGEYLIAMKLKSGRRYKYDLSDIVGILWEHQKGGNPISKVLIEKAVVDLYGGWEDIPETSKQLLDTIFSDGDYEELYSKCRENEQWAEKVLLDFDKSNPKALKTEIIDSILEQATRKIREKEE